MSTAETTATIPSEWLKHQQVFADSLIAEFDEGKSLRDATRAANRASQHSRMLSGSGVLEVWKTSGLIDGAMDTEEGRIVFEGGRVFDHGDVDIQSGSVVRWEAALTHLHHAIEIVSDRQEPSRAVAILSEICAGLENTTHILAIHGQRVWEKIDPSVQPAVLGQLPAAFRDQLALRVTAQAPQKCEQTLGTKQIDHAWLVEAIQLEATGRSEESLDIIFEKLDDWLLGGSFDACSSFLADAPVNELSTAQLLTILTATLPACTKLPARATFFDRVRQFLRGRGEDADTLLSGLKS